MPSLFGRATVALAGLSARSTVYNPTHYPPESSNINNLTFVLHGTGAPGIYNSSFTPAASYGEYNWCSMPHVRATEYPVPASEYTLQYVEVIHRHHKRTPYASNTFFKEDVSWDCVNEGPVYYGKNFSETSLPVAPVAWQMLTSSANPMTVVVGPGFVNSTCQFPQISGQGLEDSYQHGLDLAGVYRDQLGFLPDTATVDKVSFRVTNNVITSQVLGALVAGLFPETVDTGYPRALIESSTVDSLEPAYSCPAADTARTTFYSTANPAWTAHLNQSAALSAKLDAVSGTAAADTAGWHVSYDHYYDNLSAKLCHGKSLPCSTNSTSLCVTQEEADEVFRLGNYEYSFLWRDAVNTTYYSGLHYGAWMMELRSHFEGKIDGSDPLKYRHNIAHDGSISPLLSILQISKMVWPGMGAEVAFELWKKDGEDQIYLRVLWGGQPLVTSTPMGTLDMIKIETFFAYLDAQLPSDLRAVCTA